MTTTGDNLSSVLSSWYQDVKTQFKEQFNTGTTKSVAVAPPPPVAPAQVSLGPFEVTNSVLGEGGYAKVVLGRHRETGQKVAIKLLDTKGDQASGRAGSSEAAVVREVAALRRAGQHANVCQLLGYYRLSETCHAMVMELCGGGEMFRLVEKYGAIDEAKVRPLFVGMLEGVRHLHAQGIAHRDLKLENILLSERSPSCVPKIVDLGLAHVHARGADTAAGWADRALTQFCGSRSYCAPEVMARLGYNGYAADVWSLGVCLFGLVAGFFPVDEASPRDWRYERLARHQHVHPERSTCQLIFGFYERPCPLSPALVDLLDRMLQVAPSKRATLAEVSAALWVHGHSTLPTAAATPHATPPAAPSTPTAAAPPPAANEPSAHQIEIDISDFLQRSTADATGAGIDYVDRSCAGSTGAPDAASAGGYAPPRICRQRAEDSVGMIST